MTIALDSIDGNQCIGNTLDTFNTNFSTIQNAINGAFSVKAAGSFSGTGPYNASVAYNIVSPITYAATGKYSVVFNTVLSSADYTVTVSSSVVGISTVITKTTAGFTIEWWSESGVAAANGGVIDFVVHGL